MSAANTVHVDIITSADPAPLKAFASAQKEAAAALKGTQQAATTAAPSVEKLGDAAKKSAGKKGGGGAGLLQLAQAADDAQYGIQGVMNNVPGLVMALGGGAAAAGGLSVALLGIVSAYKIIQKMGKDGVSQRFLTDILPDDAALERMNKFTESIKAQSEAFERLRETKKALAEDAAAELAAQQEKEKHDLAGIPEGSRAGSAAIDEFNAGQATRGAALNVQKGNVVDRVAQVTSLDGQFTAQKKVVDDTIKRDLLTKQLAEAKEIVSNRAAHDAAVDAQKYNTSGFQTNVPAATHSKAEAEAARNQAAAIEEKMKGLAMPALSQPLTGDSEKDTTILQAALALEKERLSVLKEARQVAAEKARAEAEELALLERKLTREQAAAVRKVQDSAGAASGVGAPLPSLDNAAPVQADFSANAQRLEQMTQQLAAARDGGINSLLGSLTEFVAASSAEFQSMRGSVAQIKATTDQLRNKQGGGQ
jgi:hypothetical protein